MITSTANLQVKNLIKILNKPKARSEQGVFAVEGIKMFLEIPRHRLVKIYVSEKFMANPELSKYVEGCSYEVMNDEVFRHISDTVAPQGILAVVKQKTYFAGDMFLDYKNNIFLILEDIQDPGNLGTIVRTAEGAGVSGIIMTKNTVDIYNPKVIRSTMGAIFRVPFAYSDDIEIDVKALKAKGTVIAAAHLGGKKNYYDEDFTGNTAFIIGNESKGISDKTISFADLLVKIPMQGKVESLNASVAASLLMYEAFRQCEKCKKDI